MPEFEQYKNSAPAEEPFFSTSMKKKILYLLLAFAAIVIIKIFFIDAYRIPTSSMANTIISGDHILVNKAAYSINTPSYIPFTAITLNPLKLLEISKPARNDVVVFQFPGSELMPPLGVYFVKRVIGLPGDTLIIKNKTVLINGTAAAPPEHARIDTGGINTGEDSLLYFEQPGWSADNMGPVVIPYKGMEIQLNHKNIYEWGMIINRELGRKAVSIEGSVISINGKPARSYTLQKDYYFLMGDNRDNSVDSRYRGFVPGNYITGRAEVIYFSFGSSVRWDRMFSVIR